MAVFLASLPPTSPSRALRFLIWGVWVAIPAGQLAENTRCPGTVPL